MTRLAITLAMVAACSAGPKKPATTGSGSGGPAVYAKKIVIGWGFQKAAATTDVFLQTTDETGKQVSYPLGNYPGECTLIIPDPAMKAVSGVGCKGVQLHAVVQDEDIIILKLRTDGGTPDPMARDEVTRVKAPGGSAIEASKT